jgi:tetratricopeptide (TPR) repeat protein
VRLIALLVAAALVCGAAEEPHIRAAASAFESGKAAMRDKQWQKAAELFRGAIEIEPTYRDAHESLIQTYLDGGDSLKAAESITKFLEIWPDVARYRLVLGRILLESQQPERALAQFSIALNGDPANAEALLGFAAAASRTGMEDRARDALDRGRKLYPSDERFRSKP